MANLYGNTNLLPANAPQGVIGAVGVPLYLPLGFTLPFGQTASISGALVVTGSTTLATLSVSGTLSATLLSPTSITFSETGSTPLSSYSTGSFVGTVAGITGVTTRTFHYTKIGNSVVLSGSDGFSGTSSSTTMTITGMPSAIRPSSLKQMTNIVIDGGVNSVGRMDIQTDGSITFYKDVTGTSFTGSGIKGLLSLSGCYTLD